MTDLASINKDAGAQGIADDSPMQQLIMAEVFRRESPGRGPGDPGWWPYHDDDDAVTDTGDACSSSTPISTGNDSGPSGTAPALLRGPLSRT